MRDHYTISRMNESLDSLGTTKIFSALDDNSGYWKVSVAEDSANKAEFVFYSVFYE